MMPGPLLTTAATILCAHGGLAHTISSNPRVRVADQPIVTQASTHTVAGCPFVNAGVPSPCMTVQWITGAARVRSMGVPVPLRESLGISMPNGLPVSVVETQERVRGM
jgi:hypothetical protein